jgi:hypothetical protein
MILFFLRKLTKIFERVKTVEWQRSMGETGRI